MTTLRIHLHPSGGTVHGTQKALLVRLPSGAEVWVPRSVHPRQDADGMLVVDSWWAEAHRVELGEALEGRAPAGREAADLGCQRPRAHGILEAARNRAARNRARR